MATIPETLQLALQHHQAGRLQEAEALYRQILQVRPDHPDALHLLGVIAHQVGRHADAVELIGKAIALSPAAEFHNHLGAAYRAQGRLDEAVAEYRQALTLQPGDVAASYNLGNVLSEQGRLEEATVQYRQALTLQPDYVEAYNNMGLALNEMCKFEEAMACYQRALEVRPDSSEAYNNLAGTLKDQGRLHEALAGYRRALAINPGNVTAHSNLLMAMSYDPDCDPKTVAAEHRKWNDQHARALAPRSLDYPNSRDVNRHLHVGYVSGDFVGHPISYWLEPLLTNHDRAAFKIYGYSTRAQVDQTTRHLEASVDVWRHIAGMSDEAVARLIQTDRIDVLVDLSGHTGCNRLLVFARKPAPVQVTYLGSLTTTGLFTMDYKLTDRFLTPPDSNEQFTEKLIRLPGCFACYKAPTGAPNVTPLPSSKTGSLTFSSFNNPAKVTPQVVAVWSKILHAVPESRLILKYRTFRDPGVQARYRKLFEDNGIETKRLELLPSTPFPDHLALYDQVDIALDPFPYNGCYTSSEALWMGVPIITLAGNMSCSRYGVTLLANLGSFKEFIATTPEEYIKKAFELAMNPALLAEIRSGLRQLMAASPLCDAKALARGIEEAYRFMWRRWCGSRA